MASHPVTNFETSAADLKRTGLDFLSKGENEQALASFNKAIGLEIKEFGERHPHVGCTLVSIGGILQSQGKYDEALKKFDEAFNILQNDAVHKSALGVIYLNKGNCYLSLGDTEKALANFKEAIAAKQQVYGENHVEVSCLFKYNVFA